jgi:hypothetical protein
MKPFVLIIWHRIFKFLDKLPFWIPYYKSRSIPRYGAFVLPHAHSQRLKLHSIFQWHSDDEEVFLFGRLFLFSRFHPYYNYYFINVFCLLFLKEAVFSRSFTPSDSLAWECYFSYAQR